MDDTIQHWELQSGHAPEDLLRFGDYNWSAFRQYGKPVHTMVLYGPEVVTMPESVLNGGGHIFRVTNILLSQHDGEAVAARLRTKVSRHEALDGVDRVDLALAALMRHTRPLAEVVRDLTPVVEALPAAEQGDMMGTIVGLSYHYLQAEAATAILEALRMSNVLEQLIGEGIEKGRVEGRVEGELEGKRASLRRVLTAKFGAVPVRLEQRIAAAGGETLDQLIIRAATADRIDLI
jgi:hypothetical protein